MDELLNKGRGICVHCSACLWNCPSASPGNPEQMVIDFRAGRGGLRSAEN
jgi:heterodisulfide reductase subunit C